jgi:hypothetical protein
VTGVSDPVRGTRPSRVFVAQLERPDLAAGDLPLEGAAAHSEPFRNLRDRERRRRCMSITDMQMILACRTGRHAQSNQTGCKWGRAPR